MGYDGQSPGPLLSLQDLSPTRLARSVGPLLHLLEGIVSRSPSVTPVETLFVTPFPLLLASFWVGEETTASTVSNLHVFGL